MVSIAGILVSIIGINGQLAQECTASTSKQAELYNLPSGVPFNVSIVEVNTAGNGPASPSQKVIPQ